MFNRGISENAHTFIRRGISVRGRCTNGLTLGAPSNEIFPLGVLEARVGDRGLGATLASRGSRGPSRLCLHPQRPLFRLTSPCEGHASRGRGLRVSQVTAPQDPSRSLSARRATVTAPGAGRGRVFLGDTAQPLGWMVPHFKRDFYQLIPATQCLRVSVAPRPHTAWRLTVFSPPVGATWSLPPSKRTRHFPRYAGGCTTLFILFLLFRCACSHSGPP